MTKVTMALSDQNFDISFGSGDPHYDAEEDDGPDDIIERTHISGNGGSAASRLYTFLGRSPGPDIAAH